MIVFPSEMNIIIGEADTIHSAFCIMNSALQRVCAAVNDNLRNIKIYAPCIRGYRERFLELAQVCSIFYDSFTHYSAHYDTIPQAFELLIDCLLILW